MKNAQFYYPNLTSEASSTLHIVTHQRLRVIMCFTFERRSEPEEVRVFKCSLLESPNVLHAVETSGTYDFLAEMVFRDMSTYQDFLKSMSEPLAKLVVRLETSFIGRRFVRHRNKDTALWVPTSNGLKRLDPQLIDKIAAEGDYMRVFSQGNNWLLHTTMCSLERRLGNYEFVRLHRSVIVRLSFIDCLIHTDRRWIAQLQDGTCEQISRSHLADMISALRCRSTTPQRALSTA